MFSEQGVSGDRVMGFTYLDDNVPPDFRAVLDSLGQLLNIAYRILMSSFGSCKEPSKSLCHFSVCLSVCVCVQT